MTVISHIFNEEYLLPWWLEHHTRIFDHGIIIDYQSTDKSIDMIKALAPSWDIVPSTTDVFDALTADRQVMAIEAQVSGWKIALNVTEFLLHPDIKSLIANAETPMRCRGVYLIDPEEQWDVEPDPNLPLLQQRTHGAYELEGMVPGVIPARERLLHNKSNGFYTLGRHSSNWNSIQPQDLLCVWTGFSPMTQKFRDRKLQIRPRIPQAQLDAGAGIIHVATEKELMIGRFGYNSYKNKIKNLLEDPIYNSIWNKWYA